MVFGMFHPHTLSTWSPPFRNGQISKILKKWRKHKNKFQKPLKKGFFPPKLRAADHKFDEKQRNSKVLW
jgi:hypothetical protein